MNPLASICIISPLHVYQPRKTKADVKTILNLNQYRNWDFRVSNLVKQLYKDQMHKVFDEMNLQGQKFLGPVTVDFTYYKGSNRISDKGNVFAVQSKFLYDAMVTYGLLQDDNDEFVKQEIIHPTKYDKFNPRCEFKISLVEGL